jgi:adenine specific DNA methylase Mod
METRNCQNCKQDFNIEPDDFSFYEKIKVPPPTFCPGCRTIRRLVWRNVRSLYKRECELCKKSLISMYSDDGAPVMCTDCFNGDGWEQYRYAKDVDWSQDFLRHSHAYISFASAPWLIVTMVILSAIAKTLI